MMLMTRKRMKIKMAKAMQWKIKRKMTKVMMTVFGDLLDLD